LKPHRGVAVIKPDPNPATQQNVFRRILHQDLELEKPAKRLNALGINRDLATAGGAQGRGRQLLGGTGDLTQYHGAHRCGLPFDGKDTDRKRVVAYQVNLVLAHHNPHGLGIALRHNIAHNRAFCDKASHKVRSIGQNRNPVARGPDIQCVQFFNQPCPVIQYHIHFLGDQRRLYPVSPDQRAALDFQRCKLRVNQFKPGAHERVVQLQQQIVGTHLFLFRPDRNLGDEPVGPCPYLCLLTGPDDPVNDAVGWERDQKQQRQERRNNSGCGHYGAGPVGAQLRAS
tara:strand:- start:37240 stop:38094 length:855 start_codon:yes stop_codon:yes gene_type:complete